MGDPTHFHISGGANPFTRTWWGKKKQVDRERAIAQWHQMKDTLERLGLKVYVIPPDPQNPGLVYPANAGFVVQPEAIIPLPERSFYLSHLLPSRARETPVYDLFLRSLGMKPVRIQHRFEGEADFFPVGHEYIFTYGAVVTQKFVPKLAIPPWQRQYGFRSESAVLPELQEKVGRDILIHPFELLEESHYHGDTVFCSFGKNREALLVYLEGLTPEARGRCQHIFGDRLIPLSTRDAFFFAANAFQVLTSMGLTLFIPEGVSTALLKQIEAHGVQPYPMDVSEFLNKGGGSVKCMIGDLGSIP